MNRWLLQNKFHVNCPSSIYIPNSCDFLEGDGRAWFWGLSYTTHTSVWSGLPQESIPAARYPKKCCAGCISQIPLWGCLHPRRHTQWLTTQNQDEVSQHGQTGQRAGSYHMNGVSTGHGIECLWVTAALLTLRTLSSPRKLRLHNRVNRTHCPKPRTAIKWHAHSEFPLLCPFSLPSSEVTSFCFIFILFSGTWSFAWTQRHTRLKTGSVNAPSHSAWPREEGLVLVYMCIHGYGPVLSRGCCRGFLQLPPAWLSSSDPTASILCEAALTSSFGHHPPHHYTGVLQGPESRSASRALVFKEHSSRGQTLSRNWISVPTLHPPNCGSFLSKAGRLGFCLPPAILNLSACEGCCSSL